ncbi:macrolide ABC transporter ATP-binding protein [Marinitoga sp. 1135]|uniref:ABC-type antimicrobial peptide transport system, ATPase component n=1 Tax=Marinitoga piezophila (strain DSM 14283 / JCM 11233 / KA3) TaxID=443254 RepID=H2J3H3_MARPK|nr:MULTISPECIES: ABC transporter ATP-binding protein [Marinitoga]AEX85789.1 ABC-type antimicrobial peptide transport system, ATPase component [Marinitoga piezophila KA3]APT76231.1 macrolide ABC transporter ATP-binding protein [Marinitoga sp. 1137]NUU95990.1 macrolide ABC transporter ATP-binding protein [Marinitoga sp. 1135]NUU97902.1 macrolide ABC transporter ATP-binding protein [Marinitoga sp. 1138]
MEKVIFEVKDVKKVYKMGEVNVNALDGINFKIKAGEFVIIMGPSGSGKSTTLHIIGCLDTPTSGKVYVDNMDVSNLSEKKLARIRREKIGFVFQQFNLLPKLTALENVELPMIYKGLPSSKRRKKAKELLEMVGLGDRIHHKPSQLSGGQMQRVAIARALANDPQYILADEPTGNLDSKSGEDIINILKDLNKSGMTVIIVTHDPDLESLGTHNIYLKDGLIQKESFK